MRAQRRQKISTSPSSQVGPPSPCFGVRQRPALRALEHEVQVDDRALAAPDVRPGHLYQKPVSMCPGGQHTSKRSHAAGQLGPRLHEPLREGDVDRIQLVAGELGADDLRALLDQPLELNGRRNSRMQQRAELGATPKPDGELRGLRQCERAPGLPGVEEHERHDRFLAVVKSEIGDRAVRITRVDEVDAEAVEGRAELGCVISLDLSGGAIGVDELDVGQAVGTLSGAHTATRLAMTLEHAGFRKRRAHARAGRRSHAA